MIKKRLFIGSSSEELKTAEIVKEVLLKDFEVTIWNDNVWDTAVFKINQNFLADLLKASLQFDFGILIGTKDDKVMFREVEMIQPRDNVLFELGLFTGRLGTSKCAFLIDKEIKLPSDFNGLTLARFDSTNEATVIAGANSIKDLFLASADDEINFFPSATLASVYYENLIVPICRFIIDNNGFTKGDTHYQKCKLNIIVPERINQDVNLQFEKLKGLFTTENVSFKYSGRPRQISVDTQIKNDTLEFIDFPTIITGINHAISNLLPNDFNKQSPDYSSILDRELRRFITTLKKLLIRGGFDEMVNVKRDSEL
ncbi:CBASS system CD-NTase-associated NAD(+) hydrolase Cap12 [Niabella drilacis]|uniref:CD-NTase-associated protein 12 n=1 Tax=Niabella drilacis (strain DSM 25811 / CCM 8410 / CCUG 62505 / LMG 26954 / E90) TaxID=1285928 RepID=CAP12_NIADE|nr:STING domain-containing protein [Niabella drilacis]A0A1G6LGU2.1 RecName: Full=CD-NTase-associated protein 12; Short=Cap12; AltName: Full=NAD(+) hydrolase; AltName: Full=TIR-STING; Short=NdSTING [Niabella drilacis]SDC42652.1 Predicted nucleotide-binding protein containing TIR-like domain-containing protein [Niabella drilacis]